MLCKNTMRLIRARAEGNQRSNLGPERVLTAAKESISVSVEHRMAQHSARARGSETCTSSAAKAGRSKQG
jgi:hypothetical protein